MLKHGAGPLPDDVSANCWVKVSSNIHWGPAAPNTAFGYAVRLRPQHSTLLGGSGYLATQP